MTDTNAKTYGGRWQVVREIGKGGQGIVYEVEDTAAPHAEDVTPAAFRNALREAMAVAHHQGAEAEAQKLMSLIQRIGETRPLPKAALKELLPLDEAVNEKTALARMKSELETLQTVTHPSLIKVLDVDAASRWHVTELFYNGSTGRSVLWSPIDSAMGGEPQASSGGSQRWPTFQ